MVCRCQGYGRYALPCRRRVRVGVDGYALCRDHQWQKPVINSPIAPAKI
jgi:hypothetical protein